MIHNHEEHIASAVNTVVDGGGNEGVVVEQVVRHPGEEMQMDIEIKSNADS